ncbi:uncharacterized protein IL334_003164 [Kwoniella shivajii]|uniref:Uncharacterized protein n=1 Tax=Kwoniella shivajii TaxID=564305 RepID=A0ABZ1CX51_9TREE|nr:hypothetical protein IL334_003164 [Kwoniella shivajii]
MNVQLEDDGNSPPPSPSPSPPFPYEITPIPSPSPSPPPEKHSGPVSSPAQGESVLDDTMAAKTVNVAIG